jgi:hypothetical protein
MFHFINYINFCKVFAEMSKFEYDSKIQCWQYLPVSTAFRVVLKIGGIWSTVHVVFIRAYNTTMNTT